MLLEVLHHASLHALVIGIAVIHRLEAHGNATVHIARAEVRGHNDHGVLEVHHTTL